VQATYEAAPHDVSASLEFSVEVREACTQTELAALVLADMAVAVQGPAATQSFAEVPDQVSQSLGAKDGLSFCKARLYAVVEPERHPYLVFANRTFTVQTDDDAAIGEHIVQVKVVLEEFPDRFRLANFKVLVNPCRVKQLTETGARFDPIYVVRQSEMSLGKLNVSQEGCTYPITYELLTPHPFLNFTAGEMSV